MIQISSLAKNFGKRVLFQNVNLTIAHSEKIGLIGPNGAGKSTLFSLILGEEKPSSGNIFIQKNVRIGHLAQEASFSSQYSVLEEITLGDKAIRQLNQEKRNLELNNQAHLARYGDVVAQLEMLGVFDLEHKAKKVLAGLGFSETDFMRPILKLSGGWQMRVLLAKLLVLPYDILLLDEPTNYLDLNAALWLKDYLSGFSGSFIMISHDKDFLDQVTNYTLILEQGQIAKIKGNYEHYRQVRKEQQLYLSKQANEQEKKRKQLEEFIARFHAQPNKASQVRSKKRVLEKMEKVNVPLDIQESIRSFKFPEVKRSGYLAISLENIDKTYGQIQVYKNFNFEIARAEKAVLVGANGAGKSTLLKILAGVIEIDSGKRKLGHNVDIGYFSQTRMDILNEHNTVLEEAFNASIQDVRTETVRTILGAFFFQGDDVNKKVSVLSGGEKSRLILAKLLINPPNFLLLDEPTTHLDIDAIEALIKALREYEGTLVFISHDIHFVRSVANTIYEVKEGNVRKFPGEFDYYLRVKDRPVKEVVDFKKEKKEEKIVVEEKQEDTAKKDFLLNLSFQEKGQIVEKHNEQLAAKIRQLRGKKEKLEVDCYAAQRIIDNPKHSVETKERYMLIVEKFQKKIKKVEEEIAQTKAKFL